MRGIFVCCARAARGHATATPMSAMNSRRLMSGPIRAQEAASYRLNRAFLIGLKLALLPQCTANVAVGSLADIQKVAVAERPLSARSRHADETLPPRKAPAHWPGHCI